MEHGSAAGFRGRCGLTKRMSEETENKRTTAPWGSVCALLALCVVILVGVWRGIDPEVILVRAVAGAATAGAVVAVASCVVHLLQRSP